MGKKSKSVAVDAHTDAAEDAALYAQQSALLRQRGDTLFAESKLVEALATYEQALTLTPGRSPERALLHANRAACFLRLAKLGDAVRECSAALEAEPGFGESSLSQHRVRESS
jgi:tetratricopeptide (TPR) repeat protein